MNMCSIVFVINYFEAHHSDPFAPMFPELDIVHTCFCHKEKDETMRHSPLSFGAVIGTLLVLVLAVYFCLFCDSRNSSHQQTKTSHQKQRTMQTNDIIDIHKHFKSLEQTIKRHDGIYNGFDIELSSIEAETDEILFGDIDKHFVSAIHQDNYHRNRYTNILPNESTRIRLNDYHTDYINANWIDRSLFENTDIDFIATQAPTRETIADFWFMVYQQKSELIVMVTKEWESGREKSSRYWPEKDNTLVFKNNVTGQILSVTGVKEDWLSDSKESIMHRQFKLQVDNSDDVFVVDQLAYNGWPDHGVPVQSSFRQLIHELNTMKKHGPVTVHCSAGIGRTGTLIAYSVIEQQMNRHGIHSEQNPFKFQIYNTVKQLKLSRAGMVQTASQYKFLYKTVMEQSKLIFK
jgi:protein tyrosine phosphatase